MKLFLETITKFIFGVLLLSLLLFLPAGTFAYWNAWLFMGLLLIPTFCLGIALFVKNKELLRKRLKTKEKQSTQKNIIRITSLIMLLGFISAGLDFKYNLTTVPNWLVILGSTTLLISYALYVEVLRENTYLSRTIEIQENQKVIDTGLYGVVRHPMYMATTLLYLSFPLVLGSLISFVIFLPFPFVLAKRIKNEEEVLENGLQGYKEYKQKVKYKMFPYIW